MTRELFSMNNPAATLMTEPPFPRPSPELLEDLRKALPTMAEHTVTALGAEVAEYHPDAISRTTKRILKRSVRLALATFLDIAGDRADGGRTSLAEPALAAAYELGRGEAREGRTMEALLAAYRVGARVAWEHQSEILVRHGAAAADVARFAQMVFAYIDELSGASVQGHRDELARSDRVRRELLERLAAGILAGEPTTELLLRAQRAAWSPPETITVVAVRPTHAAQVLQLLDPRTLWISGDVATDQPLDDWSVLLVPDGDHSRAALFDLLSGRAAVVGPARPWDDGAVSYRRVLHLLALGPVPDDRPVDTDDHLLELVLGADAPALLDLRERVLAPLDGERPVSRARLAETLRAWLIHQGRRDAVAAELQVHPQTVRYRMTRIRELFGARLDDPRARLELIVGLATS